MQHRLRHARALLEPDRVEDLRSLLVHRALGLDVPVALLREDEGGLLRTGVLHHDPHHLVEQARQDHLAGEGLRGFHHRADVESIARPAVGGGGRRRGAGGEAGGPPLGTADEQGIAGLELLHLPRGPPPLVAVERLEEVGPGVERVPFREPVERGPLVRQGLLVHELVVSRRTNGLVVQAQGVVLPPLDPRPLRLHQQVLVGEVLRAVGGPGPELLLVARDLREALLPLHGPRAVTQAEQDQRVGGVAGPEGGGMAAQGRGEVDRLAERLERGLEGPVEVEHLRLEDVEERDRVEVPVVVAGAEERGLVRLPGREGLAIRGAALEVHDEQLHPAQRVVGEVVPDLAREEGGGRHFLEQGRQGSRAGREPVVEGVEHGVAGEDELAGVEARLVRLGVGALRLAEVPEPGGDVVRDEVQGARLVPERDGLEPLGQPA